MQIPSVIMRLLVILSATLVTASVRAGTLVSRSDSDAVTASLLSSSSSPVVGGGTGSVVGGGGGAVLFLRRPSGVAAPSNVGLPRQRSIQDGNLSLGAQSTTGGHPSMSAGAVPEKNVYRTKLSKLKLILLADMLNDIVSICITRDYFLSG